MTIARLQVSNLRCFEAVEFVPGPAVNWLVGENGAGKTTLLEAAFILSHGRSFRAGGRSAPCRQGANEYAVHAEVARGEGKGARNLGLMRRVGHWEARLDGQDLTTLAPLFAACPVVHFGPESPSLLLGPAEERRNFLDWSVFHVEHDSLDAWRRWRRALRQRNVLLRMDRPDAEFEAWEHDLETLADRIHHVRAKCLASLEPYLVEEAASLVPELGGVRFEYHPGWNQATGLAEQLAAQRASDREKGFTQRGVHRADWALRFQRVARREHLSRGQAKAAALVCMLAQTRWLRDRLGAYPLLCLDDLNSELDADHAAKIVQWLAGRPLQTWLTSTRLPTQVQCPEGSCMFHVEHHGIVPY